MNFDHARQWFLIVSILLTLLAQAENGEVFTAGKWFFSPLISCDRRRRVTSEDTALRSSEDTAFPSALCHGTREKGAKASIQGFSSRCINGDAAGTLIGRLSSDVEGLGADGLSDGMNCRLGNIIDWQSPRNAGRCLLRLRGGGVPKFFAWLSERYPLINHDVKSDVSMPAIDNLYLDMNGIIHPCTHGNSDELVDLTQNEMFLKIFAFLDELVHVVKPQQLLFLAIDGVAPRAKMNQQRARRFKAAKDLSEKLDKAHSRGGHVPKVLSLLALLARQYKY